jgi:hypothetical protein
MIAYKYGLGSHMLYIGFDDLVMYLKACMPTISLPSPQLTNAALLC